MGHIFISHSNKGEERAATERLVSYLGAKKLFCWVDFQDIRMGEWDRQIARGMREADAFIFVCGRNALMSDECRGEIERIYNDKLSDKLLVYHCDDSFFSDPELQDRYGYRLKALGLKQSILLKNFADEQSAFAAIYSLLPVGLTVLSNDVNDFVLSDDRSTLIKYKGGDDSVTVPDFVTHIGDYAFYGNKHTAKITLPDSVASVGKKAFCGCEKLTFFEGGNRITRCGCDMIEENSPVVRTENGVRFLNNIALGCEEGAREIAVPEGITVIADGAFRDCVSLVSFTLPSSLKIIGEAAFGGCVNLAAGEVASGVTVGEGAFACTPKYRRQG